MNESVHEKVQPGDYCVCLIDLLGYRERFRGEGRMPDLAIETNRIDFDKKLQETVDVIDDIRRSADRLFDKARKFPDNKASHLSLDQRSEMKRLWETEVRKHPFSDSLVYYVPIGRNSNVPLPVLGVMRLIIDSGLLSLLALGRQIAFRGAIDVAWGVERYPGELLGAAPVKAYEFESKTADYPRILVSPRAIEFLRNPDTTGSEPDRQKELGRETIEGLLCTDVDGFRFVDYLNEHFARMVVNESDAPGFYDRAVQFVRAEAEKYTREENWKLAGRYNRLLFYFESRRQNWCPTTSRAGQTSPEVKQSAHLGAS